MEHVASFKVEVFDEVGEFYAIVTATNNADETLDTVAAQDSYPEGAVAKAMEKALAIL